MAVLLKQHVPDDWVIVNKKDLQKVKMPNKQTFQTKCAIMWYIKYKSISSLALDHTMIESEQIESLFFIILVDSLQYHCDGN